MKRITIALVSMLIFVGKSTAWAGACETSLMPAFTANQATAICTKFPDSIAESLIPQTDNALDLGSASKTWRTLYTGTSRIAKTSDILRVRQDAQRLFTWDGSSDTALTQTFGDGGTTAAQTLAITASTADADDDSTVSLGGGGATPADGTRGAEIILKGNEVASTGGAVNIYSGNVGASADINMNLGVSSAIFDWKNAAGNSILSLTNGGVLTSDASNGGGFVLARTGTTIAVDSGTAATTCSGQLTANGATPVVTNTTCALTASRIFLSKQSASTAVNGSCTVTAIANATSFTVACLATDTGAYNFWITQEG
jgi:hypothetical protein